MLNNNVKRGAMAEEASRHASCMNNKLTATELL